MACLIKTIACATLALYGATFSISAQEADLDWLGPAQDADPEWISYNVDLSGGGMPITDHLRYGYPGSNDDLFRATCIVGAETATIHAMLSADTTGLENGSDVQLVVIDEAGEETALLGTVARSWQEDFGIFGVRLNEDFDGPLVRLLMRNSSLSYAINGRPWAELDTSAAAPVVDAFLSDCAWRYQERTLPWSQDLILFLPPPVPFTCDGLDRITSPSTRHRIPMTFVNAADDSRQISWLDPDGEQHHVDVLAQGETMTIEAYSRNAFVISDEAGNCLELARATLGQPSFEMAVPGLVPGQD